jgi:curved DNA-binding protein CbpA
MLNAEFSPDWIKRFSGDPYAVLGLAVTADDRRLLKRYRQIAKLLHPDVHAQKDQAIRDFTSQVLTRLVNPAYQRLKQDKGRSETLATLRFQGATAQPRREARPASGDGQAIDGGS